MNIMKKISALLIVCMLSMMLPVTVSAAKVTKVVITAVEPVVGQTRSFSASVPETASTEIYEVHWTGEFDNGKFIQGNDYTITVKLKIKESSSNTFAASGSINATVNGNKANVTTDTIRKQEISVKYTWKKLGGEKVDTPESQLKAKLKELAAAYTATSATDDKELLAYLRGKLPGAEIWSAGGSYSFTRKMPSETKDGSITMSVGITYQGVTLDKCSVTAVIPATSKSPDAANLSADKALMQEALKNFAVTAKTTGEEVLAAVNAAAAHGTKAVWDTDYKYTAPSATVQGSIVGSIIITLGSAKDIITARKTLPIDGSAADAAIDADFSALSRALHNVSVTNKTTQEELIKTANAAIKNGSKLTFAGFTKTDATYDAEGKIVIFFEMELDGKTRSPRIEMKIPKVRSSMPSEISVTKDEWEVLRLTNIERYKEGRNPLAMVAPLQDAADIRAEELVIDYRLDHLRPDGSSCYTAIDPSFVVGRAFVENGFKGEMTPAQAVEGWMNSSGHRANILNAAHCYLGTGVHAVGTYKYWIQMFSDGSGITDARTSTGSDNFATVTDMEDAYLICATGDGVTAYVPLEADCMAKDGNKYTMHLKGKSVTVTVGADNSGNASGKGFADVPAGAYFAEPVSWAVGKSITNGTSATTFSPNNTCTRAQILTFLWRAAGEPKVSVSNPFGDIKASDYYYNAALWAYSKGMVSGKSFAPNTPCTRSATVVYLWKNAGSPKASYTGNFADVSKSSDYASAVAWAVSNNITTGTSATTFAPATTCTRGQIVTFLYRTASKGLI